MRIGFIIPTELESQNLNEYNSHITCAGFGAGKAAACSAAAKLVYEKHCDTIIIWGLAGSLDKNVNVNDIVVGNKVAYRDYDITPLQGAKGVGEVPGYAPNIWVELDQNLVLQIRDALEKEFPDRIVKQGAICTGDQFVQHSSEDSYNRVEKEAQAVDMESAAVVHFCENLNKFSGKKIKVGIVRVISDNADHSAHVDFNSFIEEFSKMNRKMLNFRADILRLNDSQEHILKTIKNYPDFPSPGVMFKDIWESIGNQKVFEEICHDLYDISGIVYNGVKFTKVAGIESRGFIFAHELAKMMNLPFVPVRKAGKLPGEVSRVDYDTEYSSTSLEVQKEAFNSNDKVLLVDDIIATGGSLLAAKKAIEECGASCKHCLAYGKIEKLDGESFLRENGLIPHYLLNM